MSHDNFYSSPKIIKVKAVFQRSVFLQIILANFREFLSRPWSAVQEHITSWRKYQRKHSEVAGAAAANTTAAAAMAAGGGGGGGGVWRVSA